MTAQQQAERLASTRGYRVGVIYRSDRRMIAVHDTVTGEILHTASNWEAMAAWLETADQPMVDTDEAEFLAALAERNLTTTGEPQ